jgi:response regulator RpfG family c-di-GMP phosphodiesterase
MSGWEVYQEIQKEYELKKVFLWCWCQDEKKKSSKNWQNPLNISPFVEKPFEQRELVVAIKGGNG